jgi:hypothetical protein
MTLWTFRLHSPLFRRWGPGSCFQRRQQRRCLPEGNTPRYHSRPARESHSFVCPPGRVLGPVSTSRATAIPCPCPSVCVEDRVGLGVGEDFTSTSKCCGLTSGEPWGLDWAFYRYERTWKSDGSNTFILASLRQRGARICSMLTGHWRHQLAPRSS